MKYIVYLTKNIKNNKIYIGIHETENPDKFDGYLGCGVYADRPKSYKHSQTAFQAAVNKYGPDSFERSTIKVFDTKEEALALEAELVNEDFIKRRDTYNIALGGDVPPLLTKQIYQYDLNGNFIKEWDSIISSTKTLNVNKDRITMCMNDKRSFYNSYWTELKVDILDVSEYRPSARGFIRVYTTTGIFIKEFENTTKAGEFFKIERSKITNAICGKYSIDDYFFLKEGENIEDYLSGKIKELLNKKVYQYSLTGEFLKEFKNISEVKKEFRINKGDLKRAIKNNSSIGDYYWSYDKFNNILSDNPEILKLKPIKVYQYTLDNKYIKTWNSITECKKEYPSVLQVLSGKRKHTKKFKFYYNKIS